MQYDPIGPGVVHQEPKCVDGTLGATKPEQLEENLGCLPVVGKLSAEHMSAIEDILQSRPASYMGYGGHGMRSIETI